MTLDQLPTEQELADQEAGLTYRTLYFRLWLQYLDTLKLLRSALEKR